MARFSPFLSTVEYDVFVAEQLLLRGPDSPNLRTQGDLVTSRVRMRSCDQLLPSEYQKPQPGKVQFSMLEP